MCGMAWEPIKILITNPYEYGLITRWLGFGCDNLVCDKTPPSPYNSPPLNVYVVYFKMLFRQYQLLEAYVLFNNK